MTILDDIVLDATLENIQALTRKYIEHSIIVQADDYLEINAQIKQPNGKRLSVADNYADVMMNHPTFNRTVSGYQHKETGVYYSPKELTPLANKALYTPIYRLTIKPDKHTVIIYDRNTIFIKITRLAHFTKSRLNTLINVLIDSDLFVHKARKTPTRKTIYNSMLQILKRDFKPFKYEWCFTFNSEISRVLLPALKRIATYTLGGTYYLYGGKRTQCTIKAYNISATQDDRKKKQYQFLPDDLIKFEITYQTEFFNRHGYVNISDIKSQLDIFSLLLDDNLKQFNKHLLRKLTKSELDCLLKAAKVESIGELMDTLKKTHTIQTNVDAELQDIRNQLANLTQSVEETRNIAEENKNDISEMKDFLGLQDAKKDKRKLRAIK